MTTASPEAQQNLEAEIGQRVHTLIWEQRGRQIAVARAIGVTSSVMSKKLRGESAWSALQVRRAAAFLGVSVAYLYGESPGDPTGPGRTGGAGQASPGSTDPNVNFGWSTRPLSVLMGKPKLARVA